MITTPDLIESLARNAAPVRRPLPPLARAALWLGGFLALAGGVTWAGGSWPAMLHRLEHLRFAVELGATFLTGITGIVAVFYLALPDRRAGWELLPIPFLSLWLAAAGYGCYRNWLLLGAEKSLRVRGSLHCVEIIVAISIPLAASLYLALRRTKPLNPARVMTVGGLGIAGLAATMLQFYHPNDVTVMDLSLHVSAVVLVILAVAALGHLGMKLVVALPLRSA